MRTIHSAIALLFCGFLLLPAAAMAADEKAAIKEIIGQGDEQMMAGAQLIYSLEKAKKGERAGLEKSAATKFDKGFAYYARAFDQVKKSKLNHYVKLEMMWPMYYNMAAARSLQDRKEEAIDYLHRMMSAGFDLWFQLNKEHDFDNIRNEPGYKQVVRLAKDAELVRRFFYDELSKQEKLFPFDLDVKTLDGKRLTLADLKGKVVILNFWGTWYEPWETEPKSLASISRSFDGRVAVVGLTWQKRAPDDASRDQLIKLAKQAGINYPLALIDKSMTSTIPDFLTWPTTLFIDKQGRVRFMASGAMDHASHWMLARLLDAEAP